MPHPVLRAQMRFALVLLVVGLAGCDTLDDVFGNDQEISGIVEEIGADFLVVDATNYALTSSTEYEGFTGLSDISVGDEVNIEYEDRNGGRVALEVEDPNAPDPD